MNNAIIDLKEAQRRIRAGEVVAIPTDTVYGLAVDFRLPGAMERLYALKGRPDDKPCPVLGANAEQLRPLIAQEPDGFSERARRWPGAVTLVVPAALDRVPDSVRRGRDTVGIRVPNHPECLQLLALTGPLAVTSANVSGEPPACTAAEVMPGVPVLRSEHAGSGIPSEILLYENGAWRALRSSGGGRITFVPVRESDFGQLNTWLHLPHVAKWWYPDVLPWEQFLEKYRRNLNSEWISGYITHIDGVPVGFIQSYNANKIPDADGNVDPEGTFGFDLYIARTDYIGRGYGTATVKAFIEKLIAEHKPNRLVIDPHADNIAAIKTYAKAGFRTVEVIEQTGYGPVCMMECVL